MRPRPRQDRRRGQEYLDAGFTDVALVQIGDEGQDVSSRRRRPRCSRSSAVCRRDASSPGPADRADRDAPRNRGDNQARPPLSRRRRGRPPRRTLLAGGAIANAHSGPERDPPLCARRPVPSFCRQGGSMTRTSLAPAAPERRPLVTESMERADRVIGFGTDPTATLAWCAEVGRRAPRVGEGSTLELWELLRRPPPVRLGRTHARAPPRRAHHPPSGGRSARRAPRSDGL